MAYLQCIAGLVLLIGGAELFVRGASRLARALGMAPLVAGLTVVALGASAPEFAVVLQAALSGEPGIAVGNVVGSNIFNTLFVLAAGADAGTGISIVKNGWTALYFVAPLVLVAFGATAFFARRRKRTVPDGEM